MKKVSFILILLLANVVADAQGVRSPLSARYTGIGTYSSNFTDAFSGSVNQAALAETKGAAAGVYGERRFMLKELSNYAAAIIMPSRLGGFGIAARYFGSNNFNHSQLGLGFGKKLSDKIAIGIQFNYNMIKLAGYGSSGNINFEAGAILHLSKKLHAGLHIYNPAGGKYGKLHNEKLASVYSSGFGYEVSDKFFISTEISKEEDQPVHIQAGMQYSVARQIFARLGVATGTGNYFFGLGLQWKTYRIDAVTTWHAQLGFTPALMLVFAFHPSSQAEED
ncbi:MAG: hypothetical protein ABIU63_18400 [Chitinophagaceae bacterium]